MVQQVRDGLRWRAEMTPDTERDTEIQIPPPPPPPVHSLQLADFSSIFLVEVQFPTNVHFLGSKT